MKFKLNQNGQASRLFLVLAVVVLFAVIIVYLVMKMAERPPAPPDNGGENTPALFYEQTLGDIKFVFMDSRDLGNQLTQEMANKDSYQKRDPLKTTERFIIVTIGAQNKGKLNLPDRSWDIGDIVDSENRHFVPISDYSVSSWIPETSDCQSLLKPEFDPVPCTKIYEVSKISTGLKITVLSGKNNDPISGSEGADSALIDLILK